jgi:hypothetical protein
MATAFKDGAFIRNEVAGIEHWRSCRGLLHAGRSRKGAIGFASILMIGGTAALGSKTKTSIAFTADDGSGVEGSRSSRALCTDCYEEVHVLENLIQVQQ